MTWRLRISSSLLLTASLAAGATVSGRIVLQDSQDRRVRGHADYSGVVVSLEAADGKTEPIKPLRATMVQKDKMFIPHVLAIPVGSSINFPNYDPIFHNAFSNFAGQIFDVGLYPPGTNRSVAFRRPGIVRVFCNIHPSMSAVIAVLPTAWFDVSQVDGSFRIANVPLGEYTLKFFHERATDEVLGRLSRRISVSRDVDLPPVAISEVGHVAAPHKNKYGKDYPPPLDDPMAYPGAR
jgi:plastocyanin